MPPAGRQGQDYLGAEAGTCLVHHPLPTRQERVNGSPHPWCHHILSPACCPSTREDGWDHSTAGSHCQGQLQPPDVLCHGSITWVLDPMSPRAEDVTGPSHPSAWLFPIAAVPHVCLHRSDDAGSHTLALLLQCSCPRLGSSFCSALCKAGLWTETPTTSMEFLPPSSLSVPPVEPFCATVGWGWGQAQGQEQC